MCLCVCVYIYIYIYRCVYIYIYIYIYGTREACFGKGQRGVSTNQFVCVCVCLMDFLGIPVNLFFPQNCKGPFSHSLSKIITFAAAPLVLTPDVRNQVLRLGARVAESCCSGHA